MKKLLCVLLAAAMLLTLGVSAMAEEPVTVTFQTWNPGEDGWMDIIIEEFEAENPDIRVAYTYMPYSDHIADMQIKMNNGEGPDVYGMQTGATYNEFRQYEEDLTPFADETWGDGWVDNYIDFCMGLLNVDGKYYGLPLGLTYAGFAWADVEKLAQYGLEVPTSLAALKEAAKVLRDNGELPMTIGAKDDWINVDTFLNIANDVAGDKIYSAIEGETPFTDEDLVKTLEIWQSLFTEGVFQDGAVGVNMYTDTTDLWNYGEALLCLNGSWAAGQYVSTDPDAHEVFNHEGADHDAFLIDWNDDGKPAGIQASVDVVLCMNTNCEHKEAAWKFIDFMLHRGQDILINQGLQYMPSRKDLVLDVQGLSEDGAASLDYIVEQSVTNIAGYREMAYADLKQVICDQLKALATGEATPAEAAEAIEAASQAQAR